MNNEIKIDLKNTHIQELLKGKRLEYQLSGIRITITPENYGYFISPETLQKIQGCVRPECLVDIIELLKS
jgi:hypothetical protein